MKFPSFFSRGKAAAKAGVGDSTAETVVAAPKVPRFNPKQIIDDFKTMDPKDPGLWPAAPRAVILGGLFASLIGAAWWFGWNTQIEELDRKIGEEEKLRGEWLDKKRQAVNLDAYRAQLAEIDTSFGVLLEQLPNQSEIGALLVDVNKTAQSNGLAIDLFRPGGENRKDFYAEIPIVVQLTGNYHDFGTFAGEVAQLPRIVTLNDLDLTTAKGDTLVLKGVVKTFRYLNEAELASQKKAGKAASKGAK